MSACLLCRIVVFVSVLIQRLVADEVSCAAVLFVSVSSLLLL